MKSECWKSATILALTLVDSHCRVQIGDKDSKEDIIIKF